MKRYIFITVLLFEPLFLMAQISVTDSLARVFREAKEDTTRAMLLSQLSSSLQFSNPDSAYRLALQGIKLAKKNNYLKGELYCKTSAGFCSWSLGDYSLAVKLTLPEIKKAEQINDLPLLGNMYALLMNAYRDQQDYAGALKIAFKVVDIFKKIDNCRSCKINNAGIASIFLGIGDLDSARHYMQNALQYPPSPGFDGWIYSVAGKIYSDLKKYDSAFKFYRISIQTLLQENNLKDLAGAYNNTASLFIDVGERDSALLYTLKSLAVSQQKKFAKESLEANLLMSEIYEKDNTDSSYNYFKLAMAAKDSLYNQEKQRNILSYKFNEEILQQEMEDERVQQRNEIKIYALVGLAVFFLVIAFFLFRNNKHKQKAYYLLKKQKAETDVQKAKVERTLEELKATQAQLIQSEKMASLGELTAGIAHEIQNPLNFVNNFSEVNKELVEELKTELATGNQQEAIEIANDIKENEEKISHHGKRADAIVKGMLQHSRQTTGIKEPTDINTLCDEYLRLSYHGLRAKDKSFNATLKTNYDQSIGNINIIPQDIGRVLLNLINNAFYAVSEKKKQQAENYEPTVSVTTKKINDKIQIAVADNGNGIPQKIVDKIFQPFFTTKPTGQGTGLGLSLAYDIVKAHGGEIKVVVKEGEGAEFVIQLSINNKTAYQ